MASVHFLKSRTVILSNPDICPRERFALPACGRAWIRFGSRKNSKPEKCLKMPQNPTRQVHALLDPALDLQDSLPLKDLNPFYYFASTIFISSSLKPYNLKTLLSISESTSFIRRSRFLALSKSSSGRTA